MKKRILAILVVALLGVVVTNAERLIIAWDPPADPSVDGYELRWGGQSNVYTNTVDVGTNLTTTVTTTTPFYCAAYSYATNAGQRVYSPPSAELRYVLPGAPQNIRLTIEFSLP